MIIRIKERILGMHWALVKNNCSQSDQKLVLRLLTKSWAFGINWSIFQDGFLTLLTNAPSSFMCCIATAAASKRFHKKTDEPYYCLGSLLFLTIPDPLILKYLFYQIHSFLNLRNWYWGNIFFLIAFFTPYDWHSLPFFKIMKIAYTYTWKYLHFSFVILVLGECKHFRA